MDFGDIVLSNLKFYDSIKAKNPPNSYTVLATINDYDTGELLCLATGTQANLRSYDGDIQDCHAESMVKRAYKRYVIDKIRHLLISNTEKDYVKQLLLSQIPKRVILFVSKFPCGFLNRYEGQEPVDPTTGDVIKRKPGRGTEKGGKIVYVEKDSCFVKLQRWLKLGVQGSRLRKTFGIETQIKMIIIGNCETSDCFNYHSHLEEFRTRLLTNEQLMVEINHVSGARRDEFIFRSDTKSQPVSIVWWHSEHNDAPNNNLEVIVDGRRRGLTRHHCSGGQIEPPMQLKVANAHLRNDLEHISIKYSESEKDRD